MSRQTTRQTPLIILGRALLNLADACREIRAAARAA